jgi:hypothetical protein
LSNFGRGGAAVDVGPDLLGIGARALVRAGYLLDSVVRNSEFAAQVCSLDTSKNTSKNTSKKIGCSGRFRELSPTFSNGPPKFY